MLEIPKSDYRSNEMHALLCLYGFNHSRTGYGDPRKMTFQLSEGKDEISLDEKVFISEDYKDIAIQLIQSPKHFGSGLGLNLTQLDNPKQHFDGAMILLKDAAHIKAGLAKIKEDYADDSNS